MSEGKQDRKEGKISVEIKELPITKKLIAGRKDYTDWVTKERTYLAGLAGKVEKSKFDKVYEEFQESLERRNKVLQDLTREAAKERAELSKFYISRTNPGTDVSLVVSSRIRRDYFWKEVKFSAGGSDVQMREDGCMTSQDNEPYVWTGSVRGSASDVGFFKIRNSYSFRFPEQDIFARMEHPTSKFRISSFIGASPAYVKYEPNDYYKFYIEVFLLISARLWFSGCGFPDVLLMLSYETFRLQDGRGNYRGLNIELNEEAHGLIPPNFINLDQTAYIWVDPFSSIVYDKEHPLFLPRPQLSLQAFRLTMDLPGQPHRRVSTE